MTQKKNSPPSSVDYADAGKILRQKAEEALQKKYVRGELSPQETQRLLHELEVHQIELEMQNDELRRAQVELEASRMRYFELYDLAPVGYVTISDMGLVVKANFMAAAELGVAKSELVGRLLTSFITSEAQDSYYLFRRKLFETGEPQVCELRLLKKDGSQVWVRLEAILAQGEDGTPVCRAVMFNITERRQDQELLKKASEALVAHSQGLETANAQLGQEMKRRMLAEKVLTHYTESLKRSNDELDSFSSSVSHDLQEPLRSIGGLLRLLEKKYAATMDAEFADFITRAQQSAQRLEKMINALLLYARLATRGGKFEEHDGAEVLREALDNLHSAVDGSRAVITSDPLPRIYGDRDQLIRVLQNLIANSIKHCDKDVPVIHVRAQQKNDHYLFAVRDNGAGIYPDDQQSIFDLFKRGSNPDQSRGSGIGLSVCKKIIERHGGRLWVESKPGVGATFYFTLKGVGPLEIPERKETI